MKESRQSNESILDYTKRLINGKKDGIYDIDYVEMYELLFGKEISSTESRKRSYGILDFLKHLEDEGIESVSENELIDKIEEQQLELKKERVKLQTEKLEYNRWIREGSRNELFEEKMYDTMREMEPIEIPEPRVVVNKGNKEGVLAIADFHFGREDTVYGLHGEVINEYNEDIFEQRMEELLEETVNIIDKEGLEIINLFICGDILEGMNRKSVLQNLQYGVVEQTTRVCEYLANWINELSKHAYVDVYNSVGNHEEIRPIGSVAGEFDKENMIHIVVFYLKSRMQENPNVTIFDAKDINYVDILGVKIASVHGQNDRKVENSIKDYVMLYGERIDILLSAHYHSGSSKTVGSNEYGNIECIQVPSICSTDSYALKIKKSAKAGARLMILEEDKGKTITYDITLR